jgi:hypothetical protein
MAGTPAQNGNNAAGNNDSSRKTEALLNGWPTPKALTGGANSKREERGAGGADLQEAATLAAWPTPNTPSGGRSMSPEKMDATGRTEDGKKHTASLEHAVKFATWPTPRQEDSEQTGAHRGQPDTLNSATKLAGWCTPSANEDAAGLPGAKMQVMLGSQAKLATSGQEPSPSPAGTTASGVLNPAFSRWLQGFPAEWCQAAILAYRTMRTQRARPG